MIYISGNTLISWVPPITVSPLHCVWEVLLLEQQRTTATQRSCTVDASWRQRSCDCQALALSLASVDAPPSIRTEATSLSPIAAAECRGLFPSCMTHQWTLRLPILCCGPCWSGVVGVMCTHPHLTRRVSGSKRENGSWNVEI